MKKLLAAAATALSTLAFLAPSPASATGASSFDPASSDPIVFVHGWNGSGSDWNTMAGRFEADGWPASHLDQWNYDSHRSNVTTAHELADEIDRVLAATGADKVDVVTHSMGGLSSRYYAKELGGAAKIDAWVSLGGPNHGTTSANACFDTSCQEMRIGSDFLTGLNSGDETPGGARYATWWSPCDNIINPDSSVSLSGARNTETACMSHLALVDDATVYGQVRDMVNS